MTEYITKEQAKKAFMAKTFDTFLNERYAELSEIRDCIDDIPAADVVEVVRCKDCKNLYPDDTGKLHWCDCHRMFVGLDDFCNYGKRMDGGDSDD